MVNEWKRAPTPILRGVPSGCLFGLRWVLLVSSSPLESGTAGNVQPTVAAAVRVLPAGPLQPHQHNSLLGVERGGEIGQRPEEAKHLLLVVTRAARALRGCRADTGKRAREQSRSRAEVGWWWWADG